jgi:hypothetical protein
MDRARNSDSEKGSGLSIKICKVIWIIVFSFVAVYTAVVG